MGVHAPECDVIHSRTAVTKVEIDSFPELLELIPDLEKYFFKIPLAEKARKDIIYEHPNFFVMKYQPPPLNDSAPTSFNRTDAMLFKIQNSLARLTRPLDHYMYENIHRKRLVDLDNDEKIILVETMRNMLADLSSTTTQARIDNLHNIIGLSRRAPQLVESTARVRLPSCNGADPASGFSPTTAQHLQKSSRSVPRKEEPKFFSKGQEFGRSIEKTESSPVGGRLAMFRAA
ncbi:hypothetical protein AYI68_g2559 [Smittium mucronatum]|uniref:Uncharacterized protein n=1 Tax=Smittium mucronatum TaxID=133383 RepID=A0A1R0H2G5_9FUNG|nr:hypothetical protein AYI68_g2559 [Smittium mucronatum]